MIFPPQMDLTQSKTSETTNYNMNVASYDRDLTDLAVVDRRRQISMATLPIASMTNQSPSQHAANQPNKDAKRAATPSTRKQR